MFSSRLNPVHKPDGTQGQAIVDPHGLIAAKVKSRPEAIAWPHSTAQLSTAHAVTPIKNNLSQQDGTGQTNWKTISWKSSDCQITAGRKTRSNSFFPRQALQQSVCRIDHHDF
jgi:hypothetical protein